MNVVVAEKPSVARDLAEHLGAASRKEGYIEGNGYKITWAFGHLVGLKKPEEYHPQWKQWSLETLPLLPKPFELTEIGDEGAKKQLGILKKLLVQANRIICATDAGREGELIFRYIMQWCNLEEKPFQRLWLNSLTPEAIKTAFEKMKAGSEYQHLFQAARCRSEADWIVGLNGTRNLTIRYGKGTLWSLGRVQTPVLAMITERDDEIAFFQSEPFWELMTTYRDAAFKYNGQRFSKKEEGEALLDTIKDALLRIEGIKKKNEKQMPPQLFDLTELQREMNKRFGISAADTLKAAQSLYESKLITYPRTDSQYLNKEMKKDVVNALRSLQPLKPEETEALDLNQLNFTKRIIDDKKVTDHHAIIPTGQNPKQIPTIQAQVFDTIHTRLLAAFYPPCLKETVVAEAVVQTLKFTAKGTVIKDPGWTKLYSKNEEKKDLLPAFVKGESGPQSPYLKEGKTQPPKSYTENSLLGAMAAAGKQVDDPKQRELLKDKGIGTPATRAAIIETLIARGYVKREKKNLKSTSSGKFLISLIQSPALKSAQLTGEWESKLKAIETGNYSSEEFMKNIEQFTKEIIKTSDVNQICEEQLGPCPKCNEPMIEGKKGFGCSAWNKGCDYVLWKEQNGIQLRKEQVQRLLQKGILLSPIGRSIYTLTRKGHVQILELE
ncbi:DNA topoisomerase 3 [Waddlia chondrophila 2032/99]|uniref:DNA topoisomerase n=2 Tax=Waddlia chondrophila TaxID=71667 RepID=D6YVX0_WADCW|nr:DNA topoisomerase 3 [Waddlia chondrophila]ADI38281.1 DNA topoisomerase III [Waddlia chondrophila WSU 86-1044]CCB91362.1 DNA topoisomerase 3 [Waddlia chondrophila 2032/99]